MNNMKFELRPIYKVDREYFESNPEVFKKIKELNELFLNETYQGNKVAYLYKNIKTGDIISFNEDICFYAASTIKAFICLMILEKVSNKELDLSTKYLIKMEDLKQDTGIIKYQKEDTEYTLEELVKLSIIESDNTAYIKLVDILGGKEEVKKYGLSLGATHTMEGKDSFGILNCTDLLIYWETIKKFIDTNELGNMFKDYLINPSVKLIDDKSINNKTFIRKYGSWDIAYHEAGYIEDEYYLIVLTQLNKKEYKNEFINKAASMINEIHEII